MTDAEYNDESLLELVAEFAEIPGHTSEDDGRWIVPRLSAADYNRIGLTRGRAWWDPRLDNGDALQLAIRLGITIYAPHISLSGARMVSAGQDHGSNAVGAGVFCPAKTTGSDLDATRRAIFETAVEMARKANE